MVLFVLLSIFSLFWELSDRLICNIAIDKEEKSSCNGKILSLFWLFTFPQFPQTAERPESALVSPLSFCDSVCSNHNINFCFCFSVCICIACNCIQLHPIASIVKTGAISFLKTAPVGYDDTINCIVCRDQTAEVSSSSTISSSSASTLVTPTLR